jgi:hypothetical protein
MNTAHVALLTAAAAILSAFAQRREPPSPDVLRGRALELVDERGTIRARLDVESSGEVVLRLLGQRGTIRVKLGASEEGSGLLLNNDATEPGIHLLATDNGSRIRIADKDGDERIITPRELR